MPWSRSRHRTAAVSAQDRRNQRVSSSSVGSWSASRATAPSSSPYTSTCPWSHAPRLPPPPSHPPLAPGAVPDPHRAAVPPATQVAQRALGQVVLPADAEHDLQRLLRTDPAGAGGGHEGEEVGGLVRAGGHPEGLHREAGVPDPGVAVVPVP